MTINSRNKRASATSLPWSAFLPLPNYFVTTDDRYQAAAAYVIPVWTDPDGHDSDSEAHWTDFANAYDGDTTTFAYQAVASAQEPLDLTFSTAIRADIFRINIDKVWLGTPSAVDTGDLEVYCYYNGAWHTTTIIDDTDQPPENEWKEYGVGWDASPELVTAVRIMPEAVTVFTMRVYGVQLLSLNDIFVTAAKPMIGSTHASHPLLKGGLVR